MDMNAWNWSILAIILVFILVTFIIIMLNYNEFKGQEKKIKIHLTRDPNTSYKIINSILIVGFTITFILSIYTNDYGVLLIWIMPLSLIFKGDSIIISNNKISNFFGTAPKEKISSMGFVQKKGDVTVLHIVYDKKDIMINIFPSKAIMIKEILDEYNYEYKIVNK